MSPGVAVVEVVIGEVAIVEITVGMVVIVVIFEYLPPLTSHFP